MAKLIGGSNVTICLAANNVSAYFNNASTERGNDLQGELATFGDSAKEYGLGVEDGNVVLTGLYDETATNIDAILNTFFAAAAGSPFIVAPALTTVGRAARICTAKSANYNVSPGSTGEYQKIAARIEADGGLRRALIHHGLTSETGTFNGTSSDYGSASTAFGAVAGLWVPTATLTSGTVKYQDSANDIDWADIGSFATVSGTTSEIILIAGTVRRYVRVICSAFTGTSFTPLSAFARLLR